MVYLTPHFFTLDTLRGSSCILFIRVIPAAKRSSVGFASKSENYQLVEVFYGLNRFCMARPVSNVVRCFLTTMVWFNQKAKQNLKQKSFGVN